MFKISLKVFFYPLILIAMLFFVSTVFAAYEKFSPGEAVTISEFVYDDNFVPTTTVCILSVYKPTGDFFTSSTMDFTTSTGRHYKTFTPDSITGVWPANMSCGTAGVDLAMLDKTFSVGYVGASSTLIASEVWTGNATRTLSNFGNLVADIWNVATSTFSAVNGVGKHLTGMVSDTAFTVWNSITRTLTGKDLTGGGSLATESYINTATSSLTTKVESASSSLGVLVNTGATLSNQQAGWTVTMSNFDSTVTLKAYQVKLWVLNYRSEPTDPTSTPTLTITDSAGSEPRHDVEMTRSAAGVYYYSYTIPAGSASGVWETEVSTEVEGGKIIKTNDYWTVSGSPADVEIVGVTDKSVPSITADVKITNKGTVGSDFYYVYCLVDSEDNLCGGDDDLAYKSKTVYINAQEVFPLSLALDNEDLTPGTYWFKIKARALSEPDWAASSEQFTATLAPTCGNGSCGGGETCSSCPADCGQCGSGGSSGGLISSNTPGPNMACEGADFNHDKKVNSIDFSILLYFWNSISPFSNPCLDMNNDAKVNSIDFSILMYQWGAKK
ncbi:MAG: dockerin type I domain-containing protein [Candidatus Gribaldobacteria bacterium]|nr:dockerin type I domain-containing protein [Candidatus Gribaldobacteria bacterium]